MNAEDLCIIIKLAFYYRANTKADNVINKLCVVGINVRTDVLDEEQVDEHYYFGLYEEVRGQSNLINPDPYVQGEDKYILKNFEPTFIAPIVLIGKSRNGCGPNTN